MMPPVVKKGAVYGDYTVVKVLGSGAFGTAAQCNGPEGNCVLKVMDISYMTKIGKANLLKEVEALCRVSDHPYIVRLNASFIFKTNFCISMEHCKEGELFDVIHKHRVRATYFSEEAAIRWFTQLLLAIKYMHAKGIVHRDLKPANIFLEMDRVRIGDLGLAKLFEGNGDLGQTKACCGTPSYMAPEVYDNLGYDSSCDIWSLGVVMYELLSLKNPFLAHNVFDVMKATRFKTPSPLPKHYSEPLKDIIMLMIQKDPKKRPSATEILKMELLQKQLERILSSKKEDK